MVLILLRPGGASRGSVEHSEGKVEESDVAISGFLYSSPRLCRLRTSHFGPVDKLDLY
jgi:hypothetical protein